MVMNCLGHIRARPVAAILAVLILAMLSAGVALATDLNYFSGNSCCSNRHFGAFAYLTKNESANGGGYVECVQEQVFPNYPSGSGSFFGSPLGLGVSYR